MEDEVREVKGALGRLDMLAVDIKATLDATLTHPATKAELAGVRAAYACGLAALAVLK